MKDYLERDYIIQAMAESFRIHYELYLNYHTNDRPSYDEAYMDGAWHMLADLLERFGYGKDEITKLQVEVRTETIHEKKEVCALNSQAFNEYDT